MFRWYEPPWRCYAATPRESALAWCLLRWSCHAVTLVGEDLLVSDGGDPEIANASKRQFGLGEVEPTAALGGVMPFDPLDEPAGLGRGKAHRARLAGGC